MYTKNILPSTIFEGEGGDLQILTRSEPINMLTGLFANGQCAHEKKNRKNLT